MRIALLLADCDFVFFCRGTGLDSPLLGNNWGGGTVIGAELETANEIIF